jgi:hypothetical protein
LLLFLLAPWERGARLDVALVSPPLLVDPGEYKTLVWENIVHYYDVQEFLNWKIPM